MIEINLLPRKKKAINRFMQLLIVWAVVGVLILGGLVGVFAYQATKVSRLNKDNELLDQELVKLEKTLKLMDKFEAQLELLNTQMGIIEKLNANRTYWARVLDDMADLVPSSMWLKTMVERYDPKTGENKLIITGLTYSNFAVADYMTSIEKSKYFERVDLVHATRGALFGKTIVSFELHVVMKG